MELAAKDNSLPFLSSLARLNSRYGISMEEDDFIERAFYVWRDIGNIASKKITFTITLGADRAIVLPKDAESVSSVKLVRDQGYGYVDHRNRYDPQGVNSSYKPNKAEVSTETSGSISSDYVSGHDINYSLEDKTIIVTSEKFIEQDITVTYSSIKVDGEGLPMLNDKEVVAIAATIALQIAETNAFMNPKAGTEMVAYLKTESDRLIQAAAIPEKINNNTLDRMLNEKISWDRKTRDRSIF